MSDEKDLTVMMGANTHVFKPTDDITVKELADIVALVGIQVEAEWLANACPENIKRHWALKEGVTQN